MKSNCNHGRGFTVKEMRVIEEMTRKDATRELVTAVYKVYTCKTCTYQYRLFSHYE